MGVEQLVAPLSRMDTRENWAKERTDTEGGAAGYQEGT